MGSGGRRGQPIIKDGEPEGQDIQRPAGNGGQGKDRC